MTTGNNLDFNHLPKGNSGKKASLNLPIDAVDQLADELSKDYENASFREWYCGVIYEFGFSKVHEWRRRAADGREPPKLFSKYVKDARLFRQGQDLG